MNTPDSISIVNRFFEALQRLKADRRIRGKKTFTDRYGINRWNLNTCEKQPERDIFQPAWLTYLARDYGVSPSWLLTGEGDFYQDLASKTARARPPKTASPATGKPTRKARRQNAK